MQYFIASHIKRLQVNRLILCLVLYYRRNNIYPCACGCSRLCITKRITGFVEVEEDDKAMEDVKIMHQISCACKT